MNKYTFVGDIDLELTNEDVEAICTSGDNDVAVIAATSKTYILAQLRGHSHAHIIDTAVEYGCNDYGRDGKPTILEAKHFIVWCAAWNIHDDQCFNVEVA